MIIGHIIINNHDLHSSIFFSFQPSAINQSCTVPTAITFAYLVVVLRNTQHTGQFVGRRLCPT
jgi:hypothetical protein